jgi:competence protein ComGC
MKKESGFLLMEALIAILILLIGFVSFVAVIGQVLKVTTRTEELTRAINQYEALIFELESGEKNDLVSYGGSGGLDKGLRYEIISRQEVGGYFSLEAKLSWRGGDDFLNSELLLSEAPIQ